MGFHRNEENKNIESSIFKTGKFSIVEAIDDPIIDMH